MVYCIYKRWLDSGRYVLMEISSYCTRCDKQRAAAWLAMYTAVSTINIHRAIDLRSAGTASGVKERIWTHDERVLGTEP